MGTPAVAPPQGDVESSLAGIAFTEDANAEETQSETATEETAASDASEATSAEETTEAAEGDEASEESTEGEETATSEATDEEQAASAQDDELPTEQQKSYSDALLKRYANKFGIDPERLQEKPILSLIKGKIDSDIEVRNLRNAGGDAEVAEDEGAEDGAEAAAEERKPVTPQEQLALIYEFLDKGPDGKTPIVTAEGSKLYSEAMLDGYSRLQEALDALEGGTGDANQVAAAQQHFTKTQMGFMTAALTSLLPHLLPRLIEGLPPDVMGKHVNAHFDSREEMRATHLAARAELAKDPRYAKIGDMIKSGAVMNFVRDNPEVMQKKFKDATGKPITDPKRLTMERYKYVVHQIRGQEWKEPTELVKEGMKAGEKHATDMAKKKAVARVAPGRTSGKMGRPAGGQQDYIERMKKATRDANPFGAALEPL